MTFGQQTPWTPAARQEFVRLHSQDLSFGDIAKEMVEHGFEGITRNACVGFARRMGIKNNRAGSNSKAKPYAKKAAPTPKPPRMVIRVKDVAQQPTQRSGDLVDLDVEQCHFALGDFRATPPYKFCTNDALMLRGGRRSPYCAEHHRLCFVPANSRYI